MDVDEAGPVPEELHQMRDTEGAEGRLHGEHPGAGGGQVDGHGVEQERSVHDPRRHDPVVVACHVLGDRDGPVEDVLRLRGNDDLGAEL